MLIGTSFISLRYFALELEEGCSVFSFVLFFLPTVQVQTSKSSLEKGKKILKHIFALLVMVSI